LNFNSKLVVKATPIRASHETSGAHNSADSFLNQSTMVRSLKLDRDLKERTCSTSESLSIMPVVMMWVIILRVSLSWPSNSMQPRNSHHDHDSPATALCRVNCIEFDGT
jgi:hypothetical protein